MVMESTWYVPELAERAQIDPVFAEALQLLPEPSVIVKIGDQLLIKIMDDWCVVVGWSHECWEWRWLSEMLPPDHGWTACVFEKYHSVYITHIFRL